jgi:hypothetical protein
MFVILVVLPGRLQLVVVIELMGGDQPVAHSLIRRQVDRQRWGLLTAALQGQAHRVGMGHVTAKGLGDSCRKLGGAVAIEQAQQGGGDGTEVIAPFGGSAEQFGAVGCGPGEAIGAAMLSGLAFARRQLGDRQAGSSTCSPLS